MYSIIFIISSITKILSFILLFYYWSLPLQFLFKFLNFCFQNFLSWTLFIDFISYVRSWTVYLLLYTVCVFLEFFKRFIPFLFKDLYHFHKSYFNVLSWLQLCWHIQDLLWWESWALVRMRCCACFWFCFFSGVSASGLGMNKSLDADFSLCLC